MDGEVAKKRRANDYLKPVEKIGSPLDIEGVDSELNLDELMKRSERAGKESKLSGC